MRDIEACNFCSSHAGHEVFTGTDLLHNTPGEYRLIQCDGCGLIYCSPRPENAEVDRLYPPEYHAFPIAIEKEPSKRTRLSRQIAVNNKMKVVIQAARLQGKILDVGCSTGIFLHRMQQEGWQVFGLEPSVDAAEYARKQFDIPVQSASFDAADYPDNFFDVVTFWDVMEHLPDPSSAMKQTHRFLRPGGWLIMNVPNPDAWEKALFGKAWLGWDVPRHFHIFPLPVLRKKLLECGFSDIRCKSFTGFHGAFVISVSMWINLKKITPPLDKIINSLAASFLFRILTWPVFRLAARLNRSSFITIIARRNSFE